MASRYKVGDGGWDSTTTVLWSSARPKQSAYVADGRRASQTKVDLSFYASRGLDPLKRLAPSIPRGLCRHRLSPGTTCNTLSTTSTHLRACCVLRAALSDPRVLSHGRRLRHIGAVAQRMSVSKSSATRCLLHGRECYLCVQRQCTGPRRTPFVDPPVRQWSSSSCGNWQWVKASTYQP